MTNEEYQYKLKIRDTYTNSILAQKLVFLASFSNLVLIFWNVVNLPLLSMVTLFFITDVFTNKNFIKLFDNNLYTDEFTNSKKNYEILSFVSAFLLSASVILAIIDYRYIAFAAAGIYKLYHDRKIYNTVNNVPVVIVKLNNIDRNTTSTFAINLGSYFTNKSKSVLSNNGNVNGKPSVEYKIIKMYNNADENIERRNY